MGNWWPNVNEVGGLEAARKAGLISALVFTGLTVLGILLFVGTGGIPGLKADPRSYTWQIGGMLFEMFLALFGAYRIKIRRGWIIFPILTLLYAYETYVKIENGALNPGWFVMHVAVILGLVSGARAALAFRKALKMEKATVETAVFD